MARHLLAVAGEDLDGDPRGRELRDCLGSALFRRVEKDDEPRKYEISLVAHHGGLLLGADLAEGNAEGPVAFLAELGKDFRDGGARRFVQRRHIAGDRAAKRRVLQNVLRRTLDDQQTLRRPLLLQQHGDASALEVEGHLVELGPFSDIGLRVREDSVVERAVDASLEGTVEIGEPQHLRTLGPIRIDVAHEPDLRLGERAGLVGAERVHGAEVMNRRQPFGDDAATGETQRTARQRDGDHHWQELRRKTDREGEREHDRLEPGPLEKHVRR